MTKPNEIASETPRFTPAQLRESAMCLLAVADGGFCGDPGKVITAAQRLRYAADVLEALRALVQDYEELCGDGLTESNQPDVLRRARAISIAAGEPERTP